MKKFLLIFATITLFFQASISSAYAIENPFSYFNNKTGIHILFPEEISNAADLVNSSGGDWGYVTIPIQSGDKDVEKWQGFMDRAKELHIIPIIRLATEGDYFNTKVWRKPNENDIIDFANFLDSLEWPTKNRYIIVFNEVNRGDEWGGAVNAEEYTRLLAYAINVFKSKNQDFFMINAGLDNAAPSQLPEYQNEYIYLTEMNEAVPGIFNQLDGFSSHSYPNPGFSQPPGLISKMSISSFDFERNLLKTMSTKNLPIFITETGWSGEKISDLVRADYFQSAFKGAWSDRQIVAVTPFLLKANGAFQEFSFLNEDGSPTLQYEMLKSLSKVRGMPALSKEPPVLLKQQKMILGFSDVAMNIPVAEASVKKDFSNAKNNYKKFSMSRIAVNAFWWLLGN